MYERLLVVKFTEEIRIGVFDYVYKGYVTARRDTDFHRVYDKVFYRVIPRERCPELVGTERVCGLAIDPTTLRRPVTCSLPPVNGELPVVPLNYTPEWVQRVKKVLSADADAG